MMSLDLSEISCYCVKDTFQCSKCASRTSHVESLTCGREEIRWLCPQCYRKAMEKEHESA